MNHATGEHRGRTAHALDLMIAGEKCRRIAGHGNPRRGNPMKPHLLFICTGNCNRSPTAEALFLNSRFYEAKSAGTDQNAVVRISQTLIDWADLVFVMSEKEDGHLTFIRSNFSLKGKRICDLDIPDNYDRNDPELIGLVRRRVKNFLLLQGYPPAL